MDITPLYELRARLKNVMISGCGLINEDFRLSRAAQAVKPLEAASPVFARIGQLLDKLLAQDPDDPSGTLLDTITLVDAVLCTQAAVGVPEQPEEVKAADWGIAVTNAPYSVLRPLLDALSNSGGGRYGYVVETHTEHPELFKDHRVKPAMVRALGASYAELADQVMEWLKEDGESVLPLLEEEFDPKGKKEMVRRVRVIDAVAGERANDFYLAQLPEAEKEVRSALIYALRHSGKNAEFLLELVKTEKGNCKKTALRTLASMEGEKVQEYWQSYMKKKPQDALPYLEETNAAWASELVTDGLKELLSPWCGPHAGAGEPLTKETQDLLMAYMKALPGKTGGNVPVCWRMAADAKDNLSRSMKGDKSVWCPEELLQYSLTINPDRALGELALSLYESKGEPYFPAAVTAQLFGASDSVFDDWLDGQMYKKSIMGRKLNKDLISGLRRSFSDVFWDGRSRSYKMRRYIYSSVEDSGYEICHRISQPLDGYVSGLFIECKDTGLDRILFNWIQPDNREYCEKLSEYFYTRARTAAGDNRIYLEPLRQCGVSECAGLAVKYFKAKGNVPGWEAWNYLQQMPGTWEAKRKETEELCGLVKNGKLKGTNLKERLEAFMDYAKTQMPSDGKQ